LLTAAGAYAEAAQAYRAVLAIQARAVEEEPNWVMARRDLVWARLRVAQAVQASGDSEGARTAYAEACAEVNAAQAYRSRLSRLLLRDAALVRDAAAAAGAPCAASPQ
jgi:hypothetical protein